MKKLLLLFLLAAGFCHAQINFPDPQFKNAVLHAAAYTETTGGIPVNVDANNNGEIEVSEALLIKRISFDALNYFDNATGIEQFTNLVELGFDSQTIVSVNLAPLVQLEKLRFFGCPYLASLNLSTLTNLKELYMPHCYAVGSLNVSNKPNFTSLIAYACELNALTMNNVPNLKELVIFDNNLTSFSFSGFPNLETLDCSNNPFASFEVSMLTNLKKLYCNNIGFSTLNVAPLTQLNELGCWGNNLTALNVAPLTQLTSLDITGNPITAMDWNSMQSMKHLTCFGTMLPSVDVSVMPNIISLWCGSQQMTTLTLNPLLKTLYIDSSPITAYNFNSLPLLEILSVGGSGITTLDVSGCPLLNDLALISNHQLEYANIKNGRHMNFLTISHNPNLTMLCVENYDTWLQGYLAGEPQGNSEYLQVNSYCSFTPGGVYNTISGQLVFDDENNGCDGNDPFFNNALLSLSDGSSTYTTSVNESGYRFYRQTGNFTLTPNLENPQYFNVSPASATINFSQADGQVAMQNFCVTANGVHPDAEIMIVPLGTARPGFDSQYTLIYRNIGNQSLDGGITLQFDDATIDWISASPTVDSQSSGTLYWQFSDLLPFESRWIDFTVNLNGPMETPPLNQGDILHFSADMDYMIPDVATMHANAELNQIVVNSLDPNDKTCLEGNTISPEMIGDYVHYNINFENIGTAEAINVVVKDVIDTTKFDLSTLQVIHASHPVVTRIEGNTVEFVFQNINLPGTAGENKGNVVFKLKTRPTLVLGNSISNKAEIFFDYNFPIETNEATSTFTLLKNESFKTDASIGIAPNPAKDQINVKANSNIKSLQLFDLQGRLLQHSIENNSEISLDISGKANGIYFLKVTTEKGNKIEKIIKE
ncbi:leucine-rich repeat domain-containing protein [Flavobacterium sp.]|uniref:T9SS type A sorting domain-containing protein n=1 Tax=Flavobacterium sp. TaxID=239 RepID=UPI0039E277E2